MSEPNRGIVTMRAALRLVAAVSSGRVRAAEKIIMRAPNIGELAFALADLLVLVLRRRGESVTQFVENGLADVARQEHAARQKEQADA